MSPKATAAGVFYAISAHIEELGRERIHPVFLLDESHLVHQDALDHLHVPANYEWDSQPLLSLVLVGLPELWDGLRLARNRSLWSRVHCRIRIAEASDADTVEYVAHRVNHAGVDRALFSSDAVSMLHEGTVGRLRDTCGLEREATVSRIRVPFLLGFVQNTVETITPLVLLPSSFQQLPVPDRELPSEAKPRTSE